MPTRLASFWLFFLSSSCSSLLSPFPLSLFFLYSSLLSPLSSLLSPHLFPSPHRPLSHLSCLLSSLDLLSFNSSLFSLLSPRSCLVPLRFCLLSLPLLSPFRFLIHGNKLLVFLVL